MKLYKT